MKRSLLAIPAMGLMLVLGACATTGGLSDQDRLELYKRHAGEPVPKFRYSGSFIGWTELGDRGLALQTRPNESWLLEFNGPCLGLDRAMSIGLTSTMNQVYTRFDKVLVRDGLPGGCPIASIRPLDTKAVKTQMKQLRQAAAAEREAAEEVADQSGQ